MFLSTWRSRFGFGLGAVAAAGLAIAGATWVRAGRESAPLDTYGSLPTLSATDQTGAAVDDTTLRGTVTIANFIFTRCKTVCPVFSMKMQRVGERLADVDDIRLVSFSVDPEHDTPEVLARFARRYDAAPPRWRFLTGDPTAIKDVVEGSLKISMERRGELDDGTPDIVHGEHFVLIDRELNIRGYYNSTEVDRIDALVRDARRLAED